MSNQTRKNNDPYIEYEHRTTRLESCIENINATLLRMESRLDNMEKKIDSNFKFMIRMIFTNYVIMIGGFTGILGVMAHGFHWIK